MASLTLADVRKKYPQASDLTDDQLLEVVAKQYGASVDEMKSVLGYEAPAPRSRTWGDVASDALVTATKSAVGLPQAFVGLIDIPTGGRVGKALEEVGYRPNETQNMLSDMYSDPQKAANKQVNDAQGFTDTALAYIKNPSTIATTVGESAGQMLGGAGAARKLISLFPKLAPWAAGAIGEGLMGAGSAEEQLRAESPDGLTTAKQGAAALASGAGTALFGAAGGKIANSKLGQKLGIADIDTMLASGATMPKTVGFLKAAATSGISEGALEEMPQSAWEQMMQNYAQDKPILEGVDKAMASGFIAGAAMGGGAGGFNSLMAKEAPLPKIEPPKSIMDQTDIDSVISAAESSVTQAPAVQKATTPIDDPMRLEVINQLPEQFRDAAIRAYNIITDEEAPKGIKKQNQKLLDDILEQASSMMQPQIEDAPKLDQPTQVAPIADTAPAVGNSSIDQELEKYISEEQAKENTRVLSDIENTDSRVAFAQEQAIATKRNEIIDQILSSDAAVGMRPAKLADMVKASMASQGYANPILNDSEFARIKRFTDIAKAEPVVDTTGQDNLEGQAPSSSLSELVPEKKVNASQSDAKIATTLPDNLIDVATQAKTPTEFFKALNGLKIPLGQRPPLMAAFKEYKKISKANLTELTKLTDSLPIESAKTIETEIKTEIPTGSIVVDESPAITRAKTNNTFSGQATGAGSYVGMTQPKGTPADRLFSNFADGKMTPEISDDFRLKMFNRANVTPKNFTNDDVLTSEVTGQDEITFRVDAAKGGNTRVQAIVNGEVVGAARIMKGMIDSIAVRKESKGNKIGENLLQYLHDSGIANVSEVPDRSPGFVAIQKSVVGKILDKSAPISELTPESKPIESTVQETATKSAAPETKIPKSTLNDNGTLTVKGDAKAIQSQLKDAGIPSIPNKEGVIVGAKNAEKAQEVISTIEKNNVPEDVINGLFGKPDERSNAEEDPFAKLWADGQAEYNAQSKKLEPIRAAINSTLEKVKTAYDELSSKEYKKNKTVVELNGDGPKNTPSMSIGEINESRKKKALEAYAKEIAELSKLRDKVSTNEGAQSLLNDLSDVWGKAKEFIGTNPSGWAGIKDHGGIFEYNLINDVLKIKPSQGNYTSNETSKALRNFLEAENGGVISNPAQQTAAKKGMELPYKKGKTGAETARNRLAYENPFLSFLATHGVSILDRSDVGGEKGRPKLIAGHGPLFRKNGLRLDELAQLAAEKGFLTKAQIESENDNGGVNALSDMINSVMRNEVVTTVKDVAANRHADEQLQEEAYSLGIDITGKTGDEVYDLVQEYHREKGYQEAVDLLTELSEEAKALSQEYNLQELVFDIEDLNNAEENSDRGQGATSQVEPTGAGQTESSSGSTVETPTKPAQESDAGGGDQGFRLTGETEQEASARLAKEDSDAKAKESETAKQDEADRKARIKKEIDSRQESSAENFQLGQSAEDSLSGQADIFSSPTAEAAKEEKSSWYVDLPTIGTPVQKADLEGDNFRKIVPRIVDDALSKIDWRETTLSNPTMYAYYLPSTKTENGLLRLVDERQDVPKNSGWVLVTSEAIRPAGINQVALKRKLLGLMQDKPVLGTEYSESSKKQDKKESPTEAAKEQIHESDLTPAEKLANIAAVNRGDVSAEDVAKALGTPKNDRNSISIEIVNKNGDYETLTYSKGDYVLAGLGVVGKNRSTEFLAQGEIEGISKAKQEVKVGDQWYDIAGIRHAEKPQEIPVKKTALSSVIDSVNKKNGEDLSESDAVINTNIMTIEDHQNIMKLARTGKITVQDVKAAYFNLKENEEKIKLGLSAKKKDELLKAGGNYFAANHKSDNKEQIVNSLYSDMMDDFSYFASDTLTYTFGAGQRRKAIDDRVAGLTQEILDNYAEKQKKKDEEAKAWLDERLEKMKAQEAGAQNPVSLADFQTNLRGKMAEGKTFAEARMMLTQEQRAKFDILAAEASRAERAKNKIAKQEQTMRGPGEALTATETIKTKHTKYGHDLWQFNLNQRVSPEEYKQLSNQARKLGGDYSSYRGNGAIPGWQFKTPEAAQAFKDLIAGDNSAAKEVMAARRDAFADDRSQSASERLKEMASALESNSSEELNRERKTNTSRRAGMASRAEANARAGIALANTMSNIARLIDGGKAQFLDKVREKKQVLLLSSAIEVAQYDQQKSKNLSYAEIEKQKGMPPDQETADFATFPSYTAYRSDLANLARQLIEVEGTKQLGKNLLSLADDTSEAYLAFAKANLNKVMTFAKRDGGLAAFSSKAAAESAITRSGYRGQAIPFMVKRGEYAIILSSSAAIKGGIWSGDGDKRITLNRDFGAELVEKIGRAERRGNKVSVPWQFESTYDKHKTLSRMNIETAAEYRAALREFVSLREQPKEADKVKELERSMIGRQNDGMDFFPTPVETADEMVQVAEIKPGMKVLEPSAGWGHIAERIREAGIEPDVVELSGKRRELLEAKGFNLVGSDFLEVEKGEGYDRILMNPPFSDRRDAEHVKHAYSLLKPGGRLVAIMGEGVFFGKDKSAQEFRDWVESVGGTDEKLAEGTFLDPSLPVNTAVNARMVVIDKSEKALYSKKKTISTNSQEVRGQISEEVGSKFRELVKKNGDAFQFDKLTGDKDLGKTLRQIGIPTGVSALTKENDNWRDGQDQQWQIKSASGDVAYVYRKSNEVQINVSKLKSTKSKGTEIYQAVESWAFANNYKFIGDSQGITGTGQIRRTENMISSILRHDSIDHVKPHDESKLPVDQGGLDIQWFAGNRDRSLGELLVASYKNIERVIPEIKYVHATKFGDFEYRGSPTHADGDLFTADDIERLADEYNKRELSRAGGDSKKASRVGSNTLTRAIYAGTLYRSAAATYGAELYDRGEYARTDGANEGIGPEGLTRTLYSRKGTIDVDGINRPTTDSSGKALAATEEGIRNFWRWFGDSKALDKKGRPLIVFHGSPSLEITRFNDSDSGLYFTNKEFVAEGYKGRFLKRDLSGSVTQAYLALENPLVIDAKGKRNTNIPVPWAEWEPVVFGRRPKNAVSVEDAFKYAIENGHDGLIVHNVMDNQSVDENTKSTAYVVKTPTQIKSATGNNGNFEQGNSNILYSRKDQTQSQEFKNWFGDSEVVDADGKPLIVYHGTTKDIDTFRASQDGMFGKGIYLTKSSSKASRYADPRGGADNANVIPVFVRAKNLWNVSDKNGLAPRDVYVGDNSDVVDQLIADGYDGIINGDEIVVFNPNQIKSAIGNNGEFDPNNPDIRYSKNQNRNVSGKTVSDFAPLAKKYNDKISKNGFELVVVQSETDLPDNSDAVNSAGDEKIEGAYLSGNTAYIVADSISTNKRFDEVAQHELSHLATEKLLSSDEWARGLRSIQTLERMNNKTLTKLGEIVDKEQPGLDAETRAREIAALLVETGEYKNVSVLDKLVSSLTMKLKAMLRAMGLNNNWVNSLNEGEVSALLRSAMDRLYNLGEYQNEYKNETLYSRKVDQNLTDDEFISKNEKLIEIRKKIYGKSKTFINDGVFDVDSYVSAANEAELDISDDAYNEWLNSNNWINKAIALISKNDRKELIKAARKQTMFHGTNQDLSIEDLEFRSKGDSLFLSADSDGAISYGENVLSMKVDFKNPLIISDSRDTFDIDSSPYLLNQIRQAGYDSIIGIDNGDVVILDSSIIKKSKTVKALYSRASKTNPHSWNAPEPSRFDDLLYKYQDKQIDTKRVIDSIDKNIADDLNVYQKEELFHNRAASRVKEFINKEQRPLLNSMKELGIDMPTLEEYLHARTAEETNILIAWRNRDTGILKDGGSGMKTADARKYLASLDPALRKNLESLAAKVDAITEETRQLYVDYGLESKDTVDGWRDMFDHYVPLMREQEGETHGMGVGQGFSVKGKEVKGRTGSTRKVVDIFANIAMQREKVIVRGEKNKVAKALLDLATATPNPDFWSVDKPETKRVYDPDTDSVKEQSDPLFKSRENVIVAKVQGAKGKIEEKAIIFNETNARAMRMVTALKNLDTANMNGFMGGMAKITRYFAAINTQYNPIFGVVNLTRDLQGAMVNLTSTPLKDQKAQVAKHTLSALKAIYLDERAGKKGNQIDSEMAALWREFELEGGPTGYREMFANSADRAEAIENELNPTKWMDSPLGKVFTANGMLKVPLAQAQKQAKGLFGVLEDYNNAMENSVRLAAYKVAKDQGLSKEKAASLAKNLTVNFNRKGQVAQQVGAFYAFFNASMQGTARHAKTLFTIENGDITTTRLSSTGKKIVYGGVLIGVVQALMLAAAGFDDDEPPQFVRERSLVIPTGWTGLTPEKGYINIPMPLGLHILPNIGRISSEFALGGFKRPADKAFKLMGLTVDAFNPTGGGGSLLQAVTPTAVDPIAAISENKDWTGKPIAKTSHNKALPGHALMKDTASYPSKVISEGINYLTGGTQYTAGAVSPTPDQVDYLFGQVTGGVGREATKMQQSISTVMTGEDLPINKIPLVGRFYGNAESQSSQANRFYSNLDRLNEHETEIKGMMKDRKGLEVARYLRDNPEARMYEAANQVERAVQQLRQRKRELIKSEAEPSKIKAIDEQIKLNMARFNESLASISKGAN